MSLMPASSVEFKKNLSVDEVKDTAEKIRSIAGSFNLVGRGEPVTVIVPTTDPVKLNAIRALPGVAKVRNQF